jgi:long-chain fatty acid transport protein
VRPDLTLAFDYQHIFYNEIEAISNSNDLDLSPCFGASPKPSYCLGGKGGLGFGWESHGCLQARRALGSERQVEVLRRRQLQHRLLKSNQQALFNILAPATIRWHLTAGATYVHRREERVQPVLRLHAEGDRRRHEPLHHGAQTGSIYMEQMDIELSWNHRF